MFSFLMKETLMQYKKSSKINKSKIIEKIYKLFYFQQLILIKTFRNMIWFNKELQALQTMLSQ
jgi:hypothetical protein